MLYSQTERACLQLQKSLLASPPETLVAARALLLSLDHVTLLILNGEFPGLTRWVRRHDPINEKKLEAWLNEIRDMKPPQPAHTVRVKSITTGGISSATAQISAAAPIDTLMGAVEMSMCSAIVIRKHRVDPRVKFSALVSEFCLVPEDVVTLYELEPQSGTIIDEIHWNSPTSGCCAIL